MAPNPGLGLVLVLALALAPGSLLGQGTPTPLVRRWDLAHPTARFHMPGRLREISGLAFTADGHLLAHGDEEGVVYRIDPRTGQTDRGFTLGEKPVKGDFEGIAVVDDRVFLVTSRGLLYETRETGARGAARYRVRDTGLGDHCEIEGLAYDARTESLLLACKTLAPPAPFVRIHRIPLDRTRATPEPLVVSFMALVPFGLGGGVHPSGLEVDGETGTLILVAAREEAILEIDRTGRVLSATRFPKGQHRQAEGVAVGPDGALYVSDEASGHRPLLTVYAPVGGRP